jgi:hypothetical protein
LGEKNSAGLQESRTREAEQNKARQKWGQVLEDRRKKGLCDKELAVATTQVSTQILKLPCRTLISMKAIISLL